MFSTAYAAGAPWNDSHWDNKRFNELLVAARAELDTAKRREMYVEMQSICRDDGGVAVLAFVSDLHALGENVRFEKDKVAANWEWDGLRHSERWWFA